MVTAKLNVQDFFHQLNTENIHLVEEFYDENALFRDPLVQLNSCAQIKGYYDNMYKNVEMINFTFSDQIESKNEVVVVWKMTLKAKNFNKNQPVHVDGVSVIKFGGKEGKAVYHRDYFDLGEFVYEGLPLVGGIIRFAKRKMASHKESSDEEV